MAKNGVRPKSLDAYPLSVYVDCSYEKATKFPHNTKTERPINEYNPVALVGDCVSINVLVSITPRLIAYMYLFITRQCYQYECVFVDHHY